MTDRRTITLAHSPDADDAFMFYALARDRIDTAEFRFEHHLKDIQSLNIDALEERFDVTAISFAMYPRVADHYALLSSGASIGDGYGPIVVANEPLDIPALASKVIAVPGINTSAYLALKLFLPSAQTEVLHFDEIQPAVREGRFRAGVLIHEGQLTWQDEGLHKVVDLGEWWKGKTGLPLPLGGNTIRRKLGEERIRRISAILRQSIQYSLDHRDEALDYALGFGRGLPRERADRFVGMYVNEMTLDYGERGRAAVRRFLDDAANEGLVGRVESLEFY
ncbi:MAG TPA: MqnA/MqnD/SBP family protein [Thermoanaerobaculia bacterium]|nr:MqnA/MqnD/SBP family protein [Thermoanaerobaculia bacterium]